LDNLAVTANNLQPSHHDTHTQRRPRPRKYPLTAGAPGEIHSNPFIHPSIRRDRTSPGVAHFSARQIPSTTIKFDQSSRTIDQPIAIHTTNEEMTSQPTASAPTQQSHNPKRAQAAPNRVAIPLPLSKPRVPKPQTKSAVDPAVEAPAKKELAKRLANEDGVANEPAQDESKNVPPTTNGVTNAAVEAPKNIVPIAEAPVSQHDATTSSSNGHIAEASQRQPVDVPSTADAHTSAPATATDATSLRKPSHIRTELPPAFVPLAGQYTSHSASSSRQLNHNPQPFQPQASRPGTNGIVFGDVESSESSPVPPQSAGSAYVQPPQQQMQRPIQPPPFNPVNHAHHFSEPQAHHAFPGSYAPPQSWNPQRGFYPSQQHPQFAPYQPHFRHPAQEHFTPVEVGQPNMPSALSRSASPGSAYAEAVRLGHDMRSPVSAGKEGGAKAFPDPKPNFSNQPSFRQQPFARQMPLQQQHIPPPDFRLDMDNAQMLRDHIRSQFSKPALTDCHLQLSHDSDASTQRIDAHKIILARSPTLLRLIQNASDTQRPQLDVHLPGRHLSLHTFNECLKYIYGGQLPPLDPPHRSSMSFMEPASAQIDRMEQALQRIATGAWLEMPAISWRGMNVATNTMSWDTLPTALEFGLDGGISPAWTLDDGSEERSSTTSSDDSQSRLDSTPSTPTNDPYATPLLQSIFQFVLHSFPPDFYPDTTAPQLQVCPRLPPLPPQEPQQPQQHEKNKLSRSADPRLSQIRFGELPSEEASPPRPSAVTTMISSLLFSLPFALLKFLLEHPVLADRMGAETVGSIMRQTILERETRRQRCLKAKQSAVAARGSEHDQETNLYWEESVEVTGHSRLGLRLFRRRKGVDTPPSSSEGTVNA
jgi:hypothetical protein